MSPARLRAAISEVRGLVSRSDFVDESLGHAISSTLRLGSEDTSLTGLHATDGGFYLSIMGHETSLT